MPCGFVRVCFTFFPRPGRRGGGASVVAPDEQLAAAGAYGDDVDAVGLGGVGEASVAGGAAVNLRAVAAVYLADGAGGDACNRDGAAFNGHLRSGRHVIDAHRVGDGHLVIDLRPSRNGAKLAWNRSLRHLYVRISDELRLDSRFRDGRYGRSIWFLAGCLRRVLRMRFLEQGQLRIFSIHPHRIQMMKNNV